MPSAKAKFIRDAHPAEEQRDALARALKEIMETIRARGPHAPLPAHKAGEIAARAQRGLMDAGLFPERPANG